MHRRSFLKGLAGILAAGAAPSFVKIGSLMAPRRLAEGAVLEAPVGALHLPETVRNARLDTVAGAIQNAVLRIYSNNGGGWAERGNLLATVELPSAWTAATQGTIESAPLWGTADAAGKAEHFEIGDRNDASKWHIRGSMGTGPHHDIRLSNQYLVPGQHIGLAGFGLHASKNG